MPKVPMPNIPKEDLKAINDSFKKNSKANIITKDAGGHIIAPGNAIVNPRGYVIKDYRGRILRQNIWAIPPGGEQKVVGSKGQMYDNIPLELRELHAWSDSDFE